MLLNQLINICFVPIHNNLEWRLFLGECESQDQTQEEFLLQILALDGTLCKGEYAGGEYASDYSELLLQQCCLLLYIFLAPPVYISYINIRKPEST